MLDLNERKALVTGGSRGIGAATCRLLARAGADVAVHYAHRRAEAEAVAVEVAASGRRSTLVDADLREPHAAEDLPGRAAEELGGLDIVVHAAGVWEHAPLASMTFETWRAMMSLHLDAAYALTRASLPYLRASPDAGIVYVTSTAAQRGEPEYAHYAASKAALHGWTKSLAAELAPVRVNAVAPGWVDTDMTAAVLGDRARRAAIERDIPRGRVATPEEIAGPIVFLVSPLAAHITGEVLNVNGGSVRCG